VAQAPAGVTIAATVSQGVPDVFADPDRILQALVNLLSNALECAPAGTAVEVDALVEEHGSRIEVTRYRRSPSSFL
jgi:signal transduction histidine kinase